MEYFYLIIIFLFGSALGSFIAVIVGRFNTSLPFLKGHSICFSCNVELQKRDLVPIFSFLFLKGRCRYCQSKIPKETIFIEILMGMLSILAAFKHGFLFYDLSLLAIGYWLLIVAIFALILLISVYDLKHFIIPDSFLVTLFVFSLLHNWILDSSFWLLYTDFISGIILMMPFLLIFLISKGTWLGFGDVKYIAVIGFLLGLVQGLSAVVLSFWIGAAFSLIVLAVKKVVSSTSLPLLKNNFTIKSEIPFGPFLSLGLIISFYLSLDLFHINELFF